MNVSHTFSSGARETSRPANVGSTTPGEFSPNPLPQDGGTAWKSGFFRTVSARSPGLGRITRAALLMQLARMANAAGQVALSVETLADRSNGSVKAVRKIVHWLDQQGAWLRVEAMTWGDCARLFPRWRIPEDADPEGQGPNLYTLLDGRGGLASATFGRQGASVTAQTNSERSREGSRGRPRASSRGGGRRKGPAPGAVPESEPAPAKERKTASNEVFCTTPPPPLLTSNGPLPGRPANQRSSGRDLPELLSDGKKEEGASVGRETTPFVTQPTKEGAAWLGPWRVLVRAHGVGFQGRYGTSASPKQWLRKDDPSEAGRRFLQLSRLFAADLRARFGVNLSETEAQEKLAAKAFAIWFERPGKGGFLSDNAHPLGCFCEELTARVRQAAKELFEEHKPKPQPKPQDAEAMPPTREEIRAANEAFAAKRAENQRQAQALTLAAARTILPRFLGSKPAEMGPQGDEEDKLAKKVAEAKQAREGLLRRQEEARRALAALKNAEEKSTSQRNEEPSGLERKEAQDDTQAKGRLTPPYPRPFTPWRAPSGPWGGPRQSSLPPLGEGESPEGEPPEGGGGSTPRSDEPSERLVKAGQW